MTGLLGVGGAVIALHKPAASARAASTRPTASQASASHAGAGTGSAGTGGAGPAAAAGDAGAATVAVAQAQVAAAGWIAGQVNPSAIVACDPAMCAALQAHGLPASRLLVLRLTAADPLGSDIVVATSAVRSQYGDRLSTVYAPLVIASFGSGPALIEVRLMAADGSAGFGSRLAAGQRDRIAAGEQLLRNKRITAVGPARAALTGGRVDVRLLVVLAALAAREPVRVVEFGDPSPGAAGMPLRSAQIDAQDVAALRSAFVFLRAQLAPYQAVLTRGRHNLLTIQFDAPSPLDLASGP
ncbi:MAG TPA: hypothetical protein VKU39_02895 [Streptosporangiaceae bacterium]|nr:hypothetical protein [Streptosporangiaceae bacterium]